MLSYGRPLHVYDLAKLSGAIVARRARDGEEVLALNGKTYTLDPSDDRDRRRCGRRTISAASWAASIPASTEATTDILIECACFDPERIALTGQKLGLDLRRAQPLRARRRSRLRRDRHPARAPQLAIELAGGEPSQIVRAGTPPLPDKIVDYRSGALRRAGRRRRCPRTGSSTFCSGSASRSTRGDIWRVAVPSWRRDVDGSADIVEEVVRIEGLTRCRRRRCRARPASPGRPRRRSRWSSAGSAAPRRRAASTRR